MDVAPADFFSAIVANGAPHTPRSPRSDATGEQTKESEPRKVLCRFRGYEVAAAVRASTKAFENNKKRREKHNADSSLLPPLDTCLDERRESALCFYYLATIQPPPTAQQSSKAVHVMPDDFDAFLQEVGYGLCKTVVGRRALLDPQKLKEFISNAGIDNRRISLLMRALGVSSKSKVADFCSRVLKVDKIMRARDQGYKQLGAKLGLPPKVFEVLRKLAQQHLPSTPKSHKLASSILEALKGAEGLVAHDETRKLLHGTIDLALLVTSGQVPGRLKKKQKLDARSVRFLEALAQLTLLRDDDNRQYDERQIEVTAQTLIQGVQGSPSCEVFSALLQLVIAGEISNAPGTDRSSGPGTGRTVVHSASGCGQFVMHQFDRLTCGSRPSRTVPHPEPRPSNGAQGVLLPFRTKRDKGSIVFPKSLKEFDEKLFFTPDCAAGNSQDSDDDDCFGCKGPSGALSAYAIGGAMKDRDLQRDCVNHIVRSELIRRTDILRTKLVTPKAICDGALAIAGIEPVESAAVLLSGLGVSPSLGMDVMKLYTPREAIDAAQDFARRGGVRDAEPLTLLISLTQNDAAALEPLARRLHIDDKPLTAAMAFGTGARSDGVKSALELLGIKSADSSDRIKMVRRLVNLSTGRISRRDLDGMWKRRHSSDQSEDWRSGLWTGEQCGAAPPQVDEVRESKGDEQGDTPPVMPVIDKTLKLVTHALAVYLGASDTGDGTTAQGPRARAAVSLVDVFARRISERMGPDDETKRRIRGMVAQVLRVATGDEPSRCKLSYEVSQKQAAFGVLKRFKSVMYRWDIERSWRCGRQNNASAEGSAKQKCQWNSCSDYLYGASGDAHAPPAMSRGLDADAASLVFAVATAHGLAHESFVLPSVLGRPMHLVEAVILLSLHRPPPVLLSLLALAPGKMYTPEDEPPRIAKETLFAVAGATTGDPWLLLGWPSSIDRGPALRLAAAIELTRDGEKRPERDVADLVVDLLMLARPRISGDGFVRSRCERLYTRLSGSSPTSMSFVCGLHMIVAMARDPPSLQRLLGNVETAADGTASCSKPNRASALERWLCEQVAVTMIRGILKAEKAAQKVAGSAILRAACARDISAIELLPGVAKRAGGANGSRTLTCLRAFVSGRIDSHAPIELFNAMADAVDLVSPSIAAIQALIVESAGTRFSLRSFLGLQLYLRTNSFDGDSDSDDSDSDDDGSDSEQPPKGGNTTKRSNKTEVSDDEPFMKASRKHTKLHLRLHGIVASTCRQGAAAARPRRRNAVADAEVTLNTVGGATPSVTP
jgi:hypothetical protein